MTYETFFAFLLFSYVASATPGPNNVMLTALGRQVGFRRGLPALFGICCGIAWMIFLLAFGLGEFLFERPKLLEGIKIAGIVLLFWLSWKIASADPIPKSNANDEQDAFKTIGFWTAFLFQWVNPKAILVTSAAISAYLSDQQSALHQGLFFAAIFFTVGIFATIPWLLAGALLQRWLGHATYGRIFNIVMGLLLASTVVLILP